MIRLDAKSEFSCPTAAGPEQAALAAGIMIGDCVPSSLC